MTTYSELVTQIRDYTETDDNVLTDTRVNDMIEHAEERIFRDVDLDVFRQTKYATLTSGDAFVTLPGTTLTDFSLIRYFMIYPSWISNNAPRTLLYGCLVEAFKFLKHPDMVQMYEQSYNQSMQTLVAEEMGRGRRDEYMDGVPRMPIPSQEP